MNRDIEVIEDCLVPENTLREIGKKWGISHQRVEQIFKSKFRIGTLKAKKVLYDNSDKFKCVFCGDKIPLKRVRSYSIYCSDRCSYLSKTWDFRNPKICTECGREYFPYRNERYTKVGGHGDFCCIDCYAKNTSIYFSQKKLT